MDISRKMCRAYFACPEINCNDYQAYPGIEEDMYRDMEFLITDPSMIYCFPFMCKNRSGDKYIVFYIWDYANPDLPKRFIIRKGYQMTEEDEEEFLRYANSRLECNNLIIYFQFIEDVTSAFPDWHVKYYSLRDIGILMEHCYFACHRGPKETIFKADLDIVGVELDKLPYIDITGTSPEQIIGRNVTLKMLRILNDRELVKYLYSDEDTQRFVDTYRICSDYIGKDGISRSQWKYMEELCLYCENLLPQTYASETSLWSDLEIVKKKNFNLEFSRHLYERLGGHDGDELIEEYNLFFSLCSKLKELGTIKIPQPDELDNVIEKMNNILPYKRNIHDMNESISNRIMTCGLEYTYGNYSIVMPRSVFDFFSEAVEQHNCLVDHQYISRHIDGRSTLLFLRRNDCIDKSFVTIEISNGSIKQVYAKCNRLPDVDVYRFLEIYSQVFRLLYNPYALIVESCSSLRCSELYTYANEYRIRQRVANDIAIESMRIMHNQITLEEVFPEAFLNTEIEVLFEDDHPVFFF